MSRHAPSCTPVIGIDGQVKQMAALIPADAAASSVIVGIDGQVQQMAALILFRLTMTPIRQAALPLCSLAAT